MPETDQPHGDLELRRPEEGRDRVELAAETGTGVDPRRLLVFRERTSRFFGRCRSCSGGGLHRQWASTSAAWSVTPGFRW